MQEWYISRTNTSLDIQDITFAAVTDHWEYRVTVGAGYTNPSGSTSFPDEWSSDHLNPVMAGARHLRDFNTDVSVLQA